MSLSRCARFVAVLATMAVAACTVKDTEAPPLAGPSEMALALHLTATPDAIYQDGASQTAVTIEALGPDSRPVRALAVRLDIMRDGVVADFGTLSSKTVVTGDDGKARVTYTAPPKPFESTGLGNVVTIMGTPIGNDFSGQQGRTVQIRLIPPGVILPPNGAPVPSIVVSPTPVTIFTSVTFDASGTSDEGVPCGTGCTYMWSFGDGGSAQGMTVTHEFRAAGTYSVTLTVTDSRGRSQTATQTVAVTASAAPTASFVYSPSDPQPGQVLFFNASASTAAPGRYIVSYEWDFGSGRTGTGVTVSKGWDTPGTYVVTLKVTDDANQVGVTSQEVPVGVSSGSSSLSGSPGPKD